MFADLHCSHCSLRPIQVNFLRPAFSARPLWMPSTAAVLKTATMHSLIMTNARGDLISHLCHESKIPQTRWRFLPGIRSKLTHAGTQTHARWQTRHTVTENKTQTWMRAFNTSDFTYMWKFTEGIPTIVIFCGSSHQVSHINAIIPLKKRHCLQYKNKSTMQERTKVNIWFHLPCEVKPSVPQTKTFNWKTC